MRLLFGVLLLGMQFGHTPTVQAQNDWKRPCLSQADFQAKTGNYERDVNPDTTEPCVVNDKHADGVYACPEEFVCIADEVVGDHVTYPRLIQGSGNLATEDPNVPSTMVPRVTVKGLVAYRWIPGYDVWDDVREKPPCRLKAKESENRKTEVNTNFSC